MITLFINNIVDERQKGAKQGQHLQYKQAVVPKRD
jgi:hypothetical protein